MKILGIETSCDETAAAIVNEHGEILSNIIHSQIAEHAPYGGVVPEIASRSHISHIDKIVKKAMDEANTSFHELDAVAVTSGPGLIGGVIVGLMMAKAISSAANIPLIGVNHLQAHALTVRMVDKVEFPFLLLLVSGGHCQILEVCAVDKYIKIGATLDDALGEAFDKVAKMLGLGYPGGPVIEKYARNGNPAKYDFPRPLIHRKNCDFSFSGMKTAIFRLIDKAKTDNPQILSDQQFINDICASFQRACGDIIEKKMQRAIEQFQQKHPHVDSVVIAGGVAANQYLRSRLDNICTKYQMQIHTPPIPLCTDNGAMIAWAGIEKFKLNQHDKLDITPRARWPLDEL